MSAAEEEIPPKSSSDLVKAGQSRIQRWLISRPLPEMAVLIIPAIVVGLAAGFGAIVFRWCIKGFHFLAFDVGREGLSFLGEYYVLLVPAIGGLFVGPLVYRFAREARGHGVPEVMEAVALRGGRIRPVVVIIKTLASSICIGSGGSAGREGPIVQIGATVGSSLGQMLRMSSDRTRMLLGCGAAGGIAATFNAPVAGVIFALEVILGEFAVSHFSTVVVAWVTASVISQIFVGSKPAFSVPVYSLESAWELLFYVFLGVLAAFVGAAFIRLLYYSEDLFEAWRIPDYLKPAIGGLGVGAVGLLAPQIFGVVHNWFPQTTALPGAYALVGMAAVFAAAARAPISAVIILFEMTGDYRIILPLMLSTVIATTLAGQLESESIYSKKLSRRGTNLRRGRDVDVMQSMQVEEVMSRETAAVPVSMTRAELIRHLQRTRRHAAPVLNEQGTLYGVVSVTDLDRSRLRPDSENLTAGDIVTRSLVTVFQMR